jgi:hypothetical protein
MQYICVNWLAGAVGECLAAQSMEAAFEFGWFGGEDPVAREDNLHMNFDVRNAKVLQARRPPVGKTTRPSPCPRHFELENRFWSPKDASI